MVALVAGSRRGEIEANLPLMCALAPRFPHYQFVVTGVSWLDRGLYDRHLAGTDVRMVVDQTYETLRNAVAAVVTSGTATLETALMRIPEVVVYRTVWWQVWLRPYVLKVPFISLVNLNLGREAVRELVQSSADPTEAQPGPRRDPAGRLRTRADARQLRRTARRHGRAGCQRPFRPRHGRRTPQGSDERRPQSIKQNDP